MKSYISRKFPLETRTTDQIFDFRSLAVIIGIWVFSLSPFLLGCFWASYFFAVTREAIAAPRLSVVAFPPISGVRILASARVSAIAFSTASAAAGTPRCLSIIAPDQIGPMGFAIPFPAISGAEP